MDGIVSNIENGKIWYTVVYTAVCNMHMVFNLGMSSFTSMSAIV